MEKLFGLRRMAAIEDNITSKNFLFSEMKSREFIALIHRNTLNALSNRSLSVADFAKL